MPKVAIIAPQFLPCSYPPTHRVRFFAKHLPESNWETVILAVDHRFMEEPGDPGLCEMLGESFRTIKVKALSSRWTRKLGIGDLGIRCFPYMLKAVRKLCREEVIDLLFIPGPPWHTFLVGPIIKREFGIPYVIDYIDPWVMSLGEGDPPWTKAYWFRKMARCLEPIALRSVDHVIAVSDGTNEGVYKRYPKMSPDMFTSIPYGGEPSDFKYLRNHPRANPIWDSADQCKHLVYIGAMLPKAYDTLRAILSACLELMEERQELTDILKLHFIGTTYEPNPEKGLVEPVAAELGLSDLVVEHPARIPYLDAINLLCQSDGIVALGTTEHHYTASKIFPSLLANRPILAVFHEKSTVVEYVNEAGQGPVVTYSDEHPAGTEVPAIKHRLEQILISDDSKILPLESERFEPFTARSMTSKLAGIFDKVIEANLK